MEKGMLIKSVIKTNMAKNSSPVIIDEKPKLLNQRSNVLKKFDKIITIIKINEKVEEIKA